MTNTNTIQTGLDLGSLKSNMEFGQGISRLLLGIFATLLIGMGMYNGYYPPNYTEYYIFGAFFLSYSFIVLGSVLVIAHSHIRPYLTIPFDITSIAIVMMLTDAGPFSAFFLFFPWTYIGYGVRYGRSELFAATAASVVVFSFVLFITDSWYSQIYDVIAYMVFLIALPFYMDVLISRIKRARQEADRANQAKSAFLATMSHEIRTPMTGIMGMTELLDKTHLDQQQQEYVEGLKESSITLHSLINDVLDLSKIEAGKYLLEYTAFDLSQLINGVVNIFKPQADKKGLNLSYEIASNVPYLVNGDHNRLRQVLLNLISNAVKYTDSGSVTVRVTNAANQEESHSLRFEIQDTGIGIDKQHQQHIFEPFYQCQTNHVEQRHGTGLGTTISSELVNTMSGMIGLESEPGEGSMFWFELPLPQVAETTHKRLSSEQADSREQTNSKLHVLLAEDTEIIAKVITTFLQQQGHTVIHVDNGKAALEALKRESDLDLVLMDMRMPEMSGLEVTRQWREIEPGEKRIPIIALTAYSTTTERNQCYEAGMDYFITKPVSQTKLMEVIQEVTRA